MAVPVVEEPVHGEGKREKREKRQRGELMSLDRARAGRHALFLVAPDIVTTSGQCPMFRYCRVGNKRH